MDQIPSLIKQITVLAKNYKNPLHIPIFNDSAEGVNYAEFKFRFCSVAGALGIASHHQQISLLGLFLKDYPLAVFKNKTKDCENVNDLFLYMDKIFEPLINDDSYIKMMVQQNKIHQNADESVSSFLARIMRAFEIIEGDALSLYVDQALKQGLRSDLLRSYWLKFGSFKIINLNEVYRFLRFEETLDHHLQNSDGDESFITGNTSRTHSSQVFKGTRKRKRRRRQNSSAKLVFVDKCLEVQEDCVELKVPHTVSFQPRQLGESMAKFSLEAFGMLENYSVTQEVVYLAPESPLVEPFAVRRMEDYQPTEKPSCTMKPAADPQCGTVTITPDSSLKLSARKGTDPLSDEGYNSG